MDKAVQDLEKQMQKTDERLDTLALQVGNIENELLSEDDDGGGGVPKIEVNNLLRTVNEVKENYQNLRKELMEVQDLQKQLSTSLQFQLKLMQSKFNSLKEKIYVPQHHKGQGQSGRVPAAIPSSKSSSTTTISNDGN